jgi:putative addiction module component (TIGR02574 family)
MNAHLKELLALSLDDRIELVEELWESIEAELEASPIPDSVKAEIDRRVDAYLADPSKSFTYAEMRRRVKSSRMKSSRKKLGS